MTTTQLMNEIITEMRMHLKNEQIAVLTEVMADKMKNIEIQEIEHLPAVADNQYMYINMFIAAKGVEGCSPRTLKQYAYSLKRFADEVGVDVLKVNANHIRVYLAGMMKRGCAKTTQENNRLYLNSFYAWLSVEDYIDKNPCQKIRRIKQEKPLVRIFTSDEIEQLRSVCQNDRERALFELMISTGMRRSEINVLKVSDINFDKREVKIHGKGSKERIGYMNPRCYFAMTVYLKNRDYNSEYVFCSLVGSHDMVSPNTIENAVHKIGNRLNMRDCVIHKFRHYFCSELCRRGMNLFYIQELMGHESINTTKRIYTYIKGENVKNEYKKYCA